MAPKDKEATKATTADGKLVISPAFDKETYEKIKSLADADERSMAQWLARHVKGTLKDVVVPVKDNLSVMSAHA